MLGQTLSKSRFLRHSNWRDPLSVVAKIDSATTLALALLIIEKGLAQDFASGTSPEFVPYLLGVGILGLLLGSRIAAAWSVEKRPKLAAWTLLLTLPILSLFLPVAFTDGSPVDFNWISGPFSAIYLVTGVFVLVWLIVNAFSPQARRPASKVWP